ncbi:MAG TPA: AraC family transcriptional regulator [Sphingomicrobium sp.]|nr:AraC family transcriptional regulator [Sphingomicrobium sp.]
MTLRPICEPVELSPGASVLVERVEHGSDSPELGRLLHFHDVSELVVFEKVRGTFFANGRRHPLGDGTVIFAPSMHHHDFALDCGAKSWRLVQVDSYLIEKLALQPSLARLSRAFCARPSPGEWARITMLLDWLSEVTAANPLDPLVTRIVELLLVLVVAAPADEGAASEKEFDHFERLLPALERLRVDPSATVPLDEAAAVCNLSPAYFSRRFKRVFGMNFTEYTRAYRLHLAARRMLSSGAAVSHIAYGVGFSSASHFTALFHQRFGVTPREYRRSMRQRARH